MKIILFGIVFFFSMFSFAQCLTVDFIAYEVECTNGQCITPALSPYPVRIDLNSDKKGIYKYARSLGNVKIESSLNVSKEDSYYNLEIQTKYVNQNESFGEVKDIVLAQDLSTFESKEIKGNGIVIGTTHYYPRVGVFPSSTDLCQ